MPRPNRDAYFNAMGELVEDPQAENEQTAPYGRKTASVIADDVLVKIAQDFTPEEISYLRQHVLPRPPSSAPQVFPEETPEVPEPASTMDGGRQDIQRGTQPIAAGTIPIADAEGEFALDPKLLIRSRALRRLV
jgi:hypothetical protein